MWSPSFVPKCPDWPHHVDVVGEFRNVAANNSSGGSAFQPHPEFQKFLDDNAAAGKGKPVYIGFGSMVIEDSELLVQIVKVYIPQKIVIMDPDLNSGGCGEGWLPDCASVGMDEICRR